MTLQTFDKRGFTLVEVAIVIFLIAIMSTLAITRFGAIDSVRQKSSLRRFVNTWEFLHAQAKARGESYRLQIDLNLGTYTVRREVPVQGPAVQQVDRLRNFRTKSEQERLAKQDQERLLSLEEEYKEDDARQGDALENVFFQTVFRDPEQNFRLGIPIEFPSLQKEQALAPGVRFRDVTVAGEEVKEGIAAIRFSSTGASEFAVVHFLVEETVMTAVVNPATGKVDLNTGDQEFDWLHGKK